MKNIHVLPTDKPSRLRVGNNGNFVLGLVQSATASKNDSYTNQNIYITSDEQINGFENNIWVYNNGRVWLWENTMALISDNKPKKIILTTDIRLAPDVQKIDDEFLEWFVKNPSCEEVEVAKTNKLIDNYADKDEDKWEVKYHIYLPKEQPDYTALLQPVGTRQETLEEGIGKQIVEYCKHYEGTDIYNAVILAIEYGYQLALKNEGNGK